MGIMPGLGGIMAIASRLPIPTYVSAGTGSYDQTGAATPGIPAGVVADDILILWQWGDVVPTLPSGYTHIETQAVGAVGSARASYKRAVGGDTAPTLSDNGASNSAVIFCIRGCVSSGSPVDVSGRNSNINVVTSMSVTGVTTSSDSCFMMYMCGKETGTTVSGQTNANLTNITERVDNGAGFAVCLTTGHLESAGASGTMTGTFSVATKQANICIALKP